MGFYVLLIGIWAIHRALDRAVSLRPAQAAYRRYDIIELRLKTADRKLRSRWLSAPPIVVVEKDGAPITTVAGIREVPLAWDARARAFVGRWPCPWNAPAGTYRPRLLGHPELDERLDVSPFRIEPRRPAPLPKRFVALTFESVKPLASMKVRAPDGKVKDWRALFDWVKYVEADAFWVMAGQTPGERPGDLWLTQNLPMIPELAAEAKRRGILFGVYAMCYLTMKNERLERYEYAQDVAEGRPRYTRAISLRDPRRPKDVAAFLKQFRDAPGVEFLGLDYIRNPLGGYELADEFFAEMPGVKPPPDWAKLTPEERIVWFARKKIMRRDKEFIDAWQWWRARRVSLIVKQIKAELGDSKPLWAFTLTWDKGWHHGQDVVMLNDAGVDADALMLYEADARQFAQMLKDWSGYVKSGDVQLVVGNVIDWPLHQKSPLGPKEFYNRTVRAIDGIYADGPAKGMFIHDLARGLRGRLGPYTSRDWMDEARAASRYFKARADEPAAAR